MSKAKRKILAVTGYRSEYIKIKTALDAIKRHPKLDLSIVALGAHALSGYGSTAFQIQKDGFEVAHCLSTNVEGSGPTAMAASIGVTILQLTPVLEVVKPDIVLCAADRFEIFAAIVASATANYPVAHVQGGEVSGTIDESFRHAMTKLSHIHFPSTELSKKRIVMMGENPERVFNVGCPSIDYINGCSLQTKEQFAKRGYGKFLLLSQHSVTTEHKDAYSQMIKTLQAIENSGYGCILIYPNPDAGNDAIRQAIRDRSAKNRNLIIEAYKTMPFEDYLNFLKHCDAVIGNSSSGIREAHIFGTPAINIGTRQQGREADVNVISVDYDKEQIFSAIKKYAGTRFNIRHNLYGDGHAGEKIAKILSEINLEGIVQKRLYF